ncbi:hypothetical protein [Helicobacter trogontum]|uniref:hypothetical protein n=1 Tax=Helicobacter trogontum TaxID=50960 RepID=UPI001F312C95|nr:hypothetical protein [Helicobacter trogontum]
MVTYGGGGALILLLALGIRIYFLEQKKDAHVDEILSIILAEYNQYGWGKRFEENKVLSSDFTKQAILWNDSSIKGAFKDIYNLWKNNRDDPHTNLYYSLLRLWHIGHTDTNLQHIFYRGVGLNLVFFLIGFYCAYHLSIKILPNEWLTLFFLSLAFLNPASISNTLFMRPYALQEMLFLAFCLGFICIVEKLKQNYYKYNHWRYCGIFGFLSALLLSSGYFAVPFVLLVFLCAILWEIKYFKREQKWRMFFPFSLVFSVIFCFILYPKYSRGFRGSRGIEARETLNFTYLKENILSNTESFFSILSLNLSWVVLGVILVGLFLAFINRQRLRCNKELFVIFLGICAFIWMYAIIYVAPYKTLRYIMSIFPIFLLLTPFAIYMISICMKSYCANTILRRIIIILLCISCIYTILPKDGSKIEFINHHIVESQPLRDDKQMVVIMLQAMYLYANILPYLDKDMIFLDHCENLPNVILKYKHIEFITDSNLCKLDEYKVKEYWKAGGLQSIIINQR